MCAPCYAPPQGGVKMVWHWRESRRLCLCTRACYALWSADILYQSVMVIPAYAGIQAASWLLDPGRRRDDASPGPPLCF